MEYQSLGRTGVQVSPLCLGGMLFGEQTDEAEALAIIDRALDAGLNFLDTANIYNRGRSEEIIGRALRRTAGERGWYWPQKSTAPWMRMTPMPGGPADDTSSSSARRHSGGCRPMSSISTSSTDPCRRFPSMRPCGP